MDIVKVLRGDRFDKEKRDIIIVAGSPRLLVVATNSRIGCVFIDVCLMQVLVELDRLMACGGPCCCCQLLDGRGREKGL